MLLLLTYLSFRTASVARDKFIQNFYYMFSKNLVPWIEI